MKKKYIAPEMWITPLEVTHILARSKPGYAVDNEEADDNNIIDIEEDPSTGDDEWLDLW
ncbi:MAG: hypothetical protein IKX65_05005 [Prevotella sp.]|nr:hypothetical protein [Prevotella sp.]